MSRGTSQHSCGSSRPPRELGRREMESVVQARFNRVTSAVLEVDEVASE